MARAGMFQTTQLRPKLAERGIELSDSQVYRLVVDKPERLSVKTLVALMDILGCSMEDLVEPVAAATAPRQRKAVGADVQDTAVGTFRPRRARIVSDEQ
ncbi:helix-turn-helix domain-containing protein [Nocardia sp. NBC_01009]|uniref:helix-turn-helix domain-containing protein n=1 Tax=Nocardia sp. NBC_01009 TaxID=2975996 RepID=UPI00386AAD5F|nr:helix-turn-helix transcriptional regulator [Nocardia sp. NBC_01009]